MRVLMLSFAFELAYPALRCAVAAGHEVHVLGRYTASGFRYSLACASYRAMAYHPSTDAPETARVEIEHWIARLGIDAVLPTDIVTTRLLAIIAPRLSVPTTPLPSPALFDRLNDKWSFFELCRAQAVPVPETRLVPSAAAVRSMLEDGSLHLPIVVKPRSGMAGDGVMILREDTDLERLNEVTYEPVLVQDFIAGSDRDVSILAKNGRIIAAAVQTYRDGIYDFTNSSRLQRTAADIAVATGLDGLAHFDAVQERATGDIYLIECNPRAWYSIYALAAAGINMIDLALRAGSGTSAAVAAEPWPIVRTGRGWAREILSGRWAPPVRWMAGYYGRDPIGAAAERWHWFYDAPSGPGGTTDQMQLVSRLVSQTAGTAVPEPIDAPRSTLAPGSL